MDILQRNPMLKPYEADIQLRRQNLEATKRRLLKKNQSLVDFASGHLYFGIHRTPRGWVYREWAPGAEAMYVTGDFCGWERHAYPMKKLPNGVFERKISGKNALKNGQKVMAIVVRDGKELERIPSYIRRVEQDWQTGQWNGVVYDAEPFSWKDASFVPQKNLFIYECHVGMAQEEGKVGTYREFRENILPKVHDLGYNTLQIMAIMEHPYYASFGYQVTNFFAPSSRFGMPEELKELINAAHELGIAVLLDVVHSHASKNTREGINEFDGTDCQYFHAGQRGNHLAWDTKCFDYGKPEVLHFLLSNLKYWMEEYHFDGFRFDGVTSMLYRNHGIGCDFGSPESYFSINTDTEAVVYLQLATEMAREVNPHAILIAEDVSAMPGLCLPVNEGGIGFDYRLAMGAPDMWIRLLKEYKEEDWNLNSIYYELVSRWPDEKVIGYCESHDQALVGDKTLMFRLCDQEMYWSMDAANESLVIDRGMALHKAIRLLTMTLGGEGYLTFMGNEFGHPEWIDFPREGNGWSYHYCRRQWSLAENPDLKYQYLLKFEKDLVALVKENQILSAKDKQILVHEDDRVLAYQKGGCVFVVNLNPQCSFDGYRIVVPEKGKYQVLMSTDDHCYGGHGRVWHEIYQADENGICLYLPNRTGIVLKKI